MQHYVNTTQVRHALISENFPFTTRRGVVFLKVKLFRDLCAIVSNGIQSRRRKHRCMGRLGSREQTAWRCSNLLNVIAIRSITRHQSEIRNSFSLSFSYTARTGGKLNNSTYIPECVCGIRSLRRAALPGTPQTLRLQSVLNGNGNRE